MILIEGMDNTGKTTLAARLAEDLSRNGFICPVKHSPGPDKPQVMIGRTLEFIAEATVRNGAIIYDRMHVVSDQVYSKILNRTNAFQDLAEGRKALVEFVQYEPVLIYCRPSLKAIVGFTDGRDQMEGVKENAGELVLEYDRVINDLKVHPEIVGRFMFYDYRHHDRLYPEMLARIMLYLRSRRPNPLIEVANGL